MAKRGSQHARKDGNRKPHGTNADGSLCISRGIALFLGVFSALNALTPAGGAANLAVFWIDFSLLERLLSWPWGHGCLLALELAVSVSLVAWAVRPGMRAWRRILTIALTAALAVVAFSNAFAFWNALAAHKITALVPVPASCLLGIVLLVLCMRMWGSGSQGGARCGGWRFAGVVTSVLACVLAFPLVQIATFGTTDYRASADCAFVPGARLSSDGKVPPVLRERLDAAIELYQQGRVPYLVLSGGTDSSGSNEASAMATYARGQGVPAEVVVEDADGTSTEAAVQDVVTLAAGEGWDKVAIVSSFYQIPRLKLLAGRMGESITVPVVGDLAANGTLPALWREVPAWWGTWFVCWLG